MSSSSLPKTRNEWIRAVREKLKGVDTHTLVDVNLIIKPIGQLPLISRRKVIYNNSKLPADLCGIINKYCEDYNISKIRELIASTINFPTGINKEAHYFSLLLRDLIPDELCVDVYLFLKLYMKHKDELQK